jgi:uncharacterized repeat protein (TIGR02543 family)
VVWSTAINPTVVLATKTAQGIPAGTGAFTSSITGLTAGTLYHVRAYATNSTGTAYGADVTFTTQTTVTFNANGGTGTMRNQSANIATALTANAFTRTHYTFSGWNTAANGSGTAYANGAVYPFTANATLYAQWTINPDAVILTGNAGVGGANLKYMDGTLTTVVADGSGNYTITVPSGWSGTVTPSLGSDVFCPANQAYTNVTANLSAQNYAHSACAQFNALSLWTSDFSYYPQGWRADLHPRVLGDVNGDGKDDAIGFGYGGVLVGLSNGTSFAPVTSWTSDFSYNQGWRMELYPRLVGDANGDGKVDLVGFGYAGAVVATAK